MRSTLSLKALYDWDNTIFSGLAVPPNVRRQVVIDNLLIETWDQEVIYPDPEVLKDAITHWASLRLPVWVELQKTLEYDYNPIDNYDRNVNLTTDRDYDPRSTLTEVTSGGDTINDYTAGFNSATANANTPQSKTVSTLGSTNTRTAGGHDDEKTVVSGRVHGNIGVTTTQKMINEQREVVLFSVERYIIDDFKSRFCLLIY